MLSYYSFQEIVDEAVAQGKKISEVILADQAAQLNCSSEEIYRKMEASFDVMVESTHTGADPKLRSASLLTGGDGARLLRYADEHNGGLGGEFFTKIIGRAMCTSNCNAAMGKIVATPTAGSCGILPGILVTLYEDRHIPKHDIVMSIFTAAGFGIVIAKNASIAGAEGGCQAECGSASGMAAAALVELQGGTPQQCADALGMSLVNQLGLVCDPVAGLVEIPCIKRNASGAAIALTSASMALAGIPLYIPADECLKAMKVVGDSMSATLKETAMGGLAATPTGKALRKQVYGEETPNV